MGDIDVLKLYKGSDMAPGIPDTPDKENCITPHMYYTKKWILKNVLLKSFADLNSNFCGFSG